MKKLVLASASPSRKQILETLGVDFEICPSSYEEDMSLPLKLNGDVYVAGLTHYPYFDSNAMRIALWKYDDAGTLTWVRSQPGFLPGWRGEMALAQSRRYQTTTGDLYIAGAIKNGPNGGRDALVVKYDEEGTLLWSKTWGGAGDDLAYGITVNDHSR